VALDGYHRDCWTEAARSVSRRSFIGASLVAVSCVLPHNRRSAEYRRSVRYRRYYQDANRVCLLPDSRNGSPLAALPRSVGIERQIEPRPSSRCQRRGLSFSMGKSRIKQKGPSEWDGPRDRESAVGAHVEQLTIMLARSRVCLEADSRKNPPERGQVFGRGTHRQLQIEKRE
jgi:hypothetical protein